MKFILYVLLSTGFICAAENPVRNSSFELDSANYGVVRFARKGGGYLKPEFDTTTSVHGKQSIRFTNPKADMIEFLSAEFKLEPGKAYTLSWYMKSDKPVRIRCGVLSGDITPQSDAWITELRWMKPEMEWKRYSFSFRAKKYGNYFTEFRWGNWGQIPNAATVWFDAVQINEGTEATPYAPRATIEAALTAPERVCVGDAQMPLKIVAVNYGDADTTLSLRIMQEEYLTRAKTAAGELQLELKAQSVVHRNLLLPKGRYGHFSLSGEVTGNGSNDTIFPIHYARVFQPRSGIPDLHRETVLGVESSYGETAENQSFILGGFRGLETDQEGYMRFFRNSGIKLLRSGNNGDAFSWNLIETAPGVFDWSGTDRLVELANRNELAIMIVLGNMFYVRDNYRTQKRDLTRLPSFVIQNARKIATKMPWDGILPPYEMWKRYAYAMASRYKGRIAAYELTNEPNICVPGKDYADYIKIAGKEIRRADPGAIVVGGGITSDFGGIAGEFLSALGESNALDFCDALSFHPYASRQENSVNPARESLLQLRRMLTKFKPEMPLWNSELYYLWGENSDNKQVEAGTRPYHLAQRFLLDIGEGIKQTMYLPDTALIMHELSPSWRQVANFVLTGLIPSPLYPAHSSLMHFFAGSTPVERINWIRGTTCYLFRDRDGQEIAAFWNNTKDKKFKFTLKGEKLCLYDIYGNSLAVKPGMLLTQEPYFLRGHNLRRVLTETSVTPEQIYSITGSRLSISEGKRMLGIGVYNHGNVPINLKLRPDFAKISQEITIKPQSENVVYYALSEECQQTKIIISDGKELQSWPVSINAVKFCRSHETTQVGNFFNFRPVMTEDALDLTIRVNDADRGPREKDSPWIGDTIELFFDTQPESRLDHPTYTRNVHRIFLSPASSNGLAATFQGTNGVNSTAVRWKITEDSEGYTATLSIPWSALGMSGPTQIGFDIAVDNADSLGSGKHTQKVWSGNEFNYKNRMRFGTLMPK